MERDSIKDRAKRAWNAFFNNKDPTPTMGYYGGYSTRPDRPSFSNTNEKSIITAVYNRIAIDVSAIAIKHAKIDENDRYIETINSGLNKCLTLEANIDQSGRAFMQDVVISMLDEGCVGLLPFGGENTASEDDIYARGIQELRTAKILEWYPNHVRVSAYNQLTGNREECVVEKKNIGIVENPFYATMNEPNSTLQRLIRKLNLLDVIDEKSGSNKLDLLVQLPYDVSNEMKKALAQQRVQDIQEQLANSKYGIAYTGVTEHVVQLNRAVENNLMSQIEYLTNMLYSQLGITQSVLDGSADEQTLLNYNHRSIEPIITAIVDEMKRKFLSKTARTQRQSIVFFSSPFRLMPVSAVAETADKMTRNEIMSPNEIRQEIGLPPSKDPNADELRNRNINQPEEESEQTNNKIENNKTTRRIQNGI